jgi:hypothetical protein
MKGKSTCKVPLVPTGSRGRTRRAKRRSSDSEALKQLLHKLGNEVHVLAMFTDMAERGVLDRDDIRNANVALLIVQDLLSQLRLMID